MIIYTYKPSDILCIIHILLIMVIYTFFLEYVKCNYLTFFCFVFGVHFNLTLNKFFCKFKFKSKLFCSWFYYYL